MRNPDVPDYQILLAHCFLAHYVDNDQCGALSSCQKRALRLLEQLHQNAPDVTEYQFELADAYRVIEWRQHRRNRGRDRTLEELQDSETRLRRVLDVSMNLEIRHPTIPQYHVLKKSLHHTLANILKEQDKLDEAEFHFRRAIERQLSVVSKARKPGCQQIWLYQVQLNHAQLLRDQGKRQDARKRLKTIVAGLEELLLVPEIDNNRSYSRWTEKYLAQAYATYACVLNRMGESDEADTVLRKAEKCES